MIKDGLSDGDEEQHFNPSSIWMILTLAIATSIDALAVGVSFACVGMQSLPQLAMPIVTIGVVSSVMSLLAFGLGIYGGRKVAGRLHPEVLGGLILIGIGVKILIEHLTA